MEPSELADFLSRPRWASVCFEDGQGVLRAVPMWMTEANREEIQMEAPAGDLGDERPQAHACLVADDFKTYVGIRGAIIRGLLRSFGDGTDPRRRALTIAKAHGFSFENTTVSL
jgi:hypothetical protein